MKTTQEMIEVMQHYANGGEIERLSLDGFWEAWKAPDWNWGMIDYRIAQPKKKKVKVLAFFNGVTLVWYAEDAKYSMAWRRVPSEDKIIEVEE